jgi:hypothetical protein
MISISEPWQVVYPGANVGFLALRNVSNPERHEVLDARKDALEADLRARFAAAGRTALTALPTIEAYSRYYGRFRKTYHVLLQLESVALKGRSVPRVAALVEAMFMAELKNQLLTAGHDLAALQGSVTVGVATGEERYIKLEFPRFPLRLSAGLCGSRLKFYSDRLLLPAIPQHRQPHDLAGRGFLFEVDQEVIHSGHRLAINRGDQVAPAL